MPTNDDTLIRLCNAGMACVAIGAGVLPVYLTTFGAEFGGLPLDVLGRLPALLFTGFVAGILLSGPAADRMGEKPFAVAGAACCAAGLWVAALAGQFNMLLAGACILGFGAGILDMLMSPLVAAVSTERRAAALNRLHAFYSLGVVATVVVSSAGIYLHVPWRLVLAVLALLPAVVAVGFLVARLPTIVHPAHERQRLRHLFRMPRFLLALVIIFLIGATEEGMSQWLPAFAEGGLGFSKGAAGIALLGYALMQSAGRMLGSTVWAHRQRPYRLIAVGSAGSACCYLVAAASPWASLSLAACICAGLACSMLWPTHLGATADRMPHGGGSMFGIMAAAGNMGCVAAPWVEGQIAAEWGLHAAIAMGAAAPLLLLGLALPQRMQR